MYLTELFLIFLAAPVVWFWLEGMTLKQRVRAEAALLCRRNQLQFLDDTVHLLSMRIKRDKRRRFRIIRKYGFEFSNSTGERYSGFVEVTGKLISRSFIEAYRTDEYE